VQVWVLFFGTLWASDPTVTFLDVVPAEPDRFNRVRAAGLPPGVAARLLHHVPTDDAPCPDDLADGLEVARSATDPHGRVSFELAIDAALANRTSCLQAVADGSVRGPVRAQAWQVHSWVGSWSADAADVVLMGSEALDVFGNRVAANGDADGDGHLDIAVGAPRDDDGGERSGSVYVFHDGGELHADHGGQRKLVGEARGDFAGFDLTWAGDLNDDGRDDLVIGARDNDRGGRNAGSAYVVFGGGQGRMSLADADAIYEGADPDDEAGRALAAFDGGVAIAAPYHDRGGRDAGVVYVVPEVVEGVHSLRDATHQLVGDAAGDMAGTRLAGLGDGTLAIGAPGSDLGSDNGGAVYLVDRVAKGATRLADAGLAIVPPEGLDGLKFGSSVDAVGDLDGDGLADLAVGARGDSELADQAGAVFVLHAPFDATSFDRALKLAGTSEGGMAGNHTVSCDLDGDGHLDLITTAHHAGKVEQGGLVHVWYGPLQQGGSTDEADAVFVGRWMDNLGQDVSCADIDDDGLDDLLLGAEAHGSDASHPGPGAVFVFLGRPRTEPAPSVAVPLARAVPIDGPAGEAPVGAGCACTTPGSPWGAWLGAWVLAAGWLRRERPIS
jgi:hypothetical protein